MISLINIGFLPVRVLDILDILIVGFLLYQIYKLLRGTIAFNIFTGLVMLFLIWWLVGILEMDLLSLILGQFVSLGMIMLVIIFQPEIRRFLLLLGTSTMKGRSNVFSRLLGKNLKDENAPSALVLTLKNTLLNFSRNKTGALIVIDNDLELEDSENSGVVLNADISPQLLESIFIGHGPLHDGAVIISNKKIVAASYILRVSRNTELPQNLGLRHRAALGVTEMTGVVALVVSEETGRISYARGDKLLLNIDEKALEQILLDSL